MTENNRFYVPNLCKNTAVLVSMLIAQVIIVIFQLLNYQNDWLITLGLTSLYVQWTLLLSTILLCYFRKNINALPSFKALFCGLSLLAIAFGVVEIGTQLTLNVMLGVEYDSAAMLRRALATILIFLLISRFFSVLHLLNQRARSEVQARIDALQARIKPHFLFNSLNGIAELIHSQPQEAERAVESLSDLFRASLSSTSHLHTLRQETDLCKKYLQLEKWRLGDRLSIEWDETDEHAEIPTLLIQPLVENAITHGIHPSTKPGDVRINTSTTKAGKLKIEISNSLPDTTSAKQTNRYGPGLGLALNNLSERLAAIYDDQFTYTASVINQRYEVALILPLKPPG
jgi:two-component system sensor histidine kinase AlgZ